MITLLPIIRDLCQFRRTPAELPHSPRLLINWLVLGLVIDVAMGHLLAIEHIVARSLLSTSLILGLAWVALAMRRFRPRFVQTALALTACSIVFSLLMLPLAWLSGDASASGPSMTTAQMLLTWLALAVLVWKLGVDAHILRHALEMPLASSISLALLWAIAGFALDRALFVPSP